MSGPIAVYGGCFDPFHSGHLAILRRACADLPVATVYVLPNGRPPHRQPHAGWTDRLRMCELGCAGIDKARVLALEDDASVRPTIDTLALLPAHSGAPILVVGADSLAAIDKWVRWQELLGQVSWAVVPRQAAGEWLPASDEAAARLQAGLVDEAALLGQQAGRVWAWPGPVGAASSTRLRALIGAGDAGYRDSLPATVAAYIDKRRLYQS